MMRAIRSFVFVDLETTGFKKELPRITEIAMMAVSREELVAAARKRNFFPRVFHNFNICVNPEKAIAEKAAEVTALTNELLAEEKTFDEGLFTLMSYFIQRVPPPVCLVAHNGNDFDYPILQAELARIDKSLPEGILCADTLPAFREHIPRGSFTIPNENEGKRIRGMDTLMSHQLKDLYKFLVSTTEVRNLHSASVDVEVLAKVVATQGDFFPLWADQHAVPFSQIAKLY